MKPIQTLTLLLLWTFSKVFAQSQTGFDCAFDALRTPTVAKKMQLFEQQLQGHLQQHRAVNPAQKGLTSIPYTVPVVVHIIHDGGSENIDDSFVLAAIQHLNEGFAAAGYFAQSGATVNTQIQFCLAKRDPDGNATSGITRTQSALTNMTKETDDIATKNLSRWNPKDYVNIWVVKEISSLSSGAGVAGYAYFPSSHGDPEDGMICEARFFGTSAAQDAVLIHEMGHYFGLYHTFEGGCANNDCSIDGDRVCDTPPDNAQHTTCPFNSCSTDVAPGSPFSSDVNDFTGDFMDYSPFTCYNYFTADQATRMQTALETARKSLLESKACGDPCAQPIEALFSLPGGPFSVGQTIALSNGSTGASNYTWYFNDVAFSTLANPVFTIPTAGLFEIKLVVTNADPNCSDLFSLYATASCPVVADFSASATSLDVGGTVFFTNTSTAATGYQWFINGVLLSTAANFNYTFSAVGDYTVILEANNGFCQTQQTVFVKVNSPCSGTETGAAYLYNIGNRNFYPYGILGTPDGGLLTFGEHIDNAGHTAILQKTAADGNVVWCNRLENAEEIFKITVSPNDNSYVFVGENKPGNSLFLMKVAAATGAMIWKKDLTNLPGGILTHDILCLPGGDLFVLMNASHLARFDPLGNLIWSKKIAANTIGFFSSLTRRPDGVILMSGFDPSQGFGRSSVVFLDENGTVLDTRYYGLPNHQSVILNTIVANADNTFTVAGSSRVFNSSFTEQRGFVFKCDPLGNIIWAKKLEFQSTSSHSAVKNYIVKTSDGGYVLFGAPTITFENRLFMKIDGDGNMLWAREFLVPNTSMNLVNIADNNTPGCWIAENGSNRLLIAKINGDGSAGGCGELNHDILTSDLIFSNASFPLLIDPFVINTTAGATPLTSTVFQKQILCSQVDPCPEICDNEFDDDADGYVDCYDTDCDCFSNNDNCSITPPEMPLGAQIDWESSPDLVSEVSTPVVGNLNPQVDSIPEVVMINGPQDGLVIFKGDGSNKTNPVTFKPPNMNTLDYQPPLLADVNADGIPELLVATWESKILVYTNYQENATPAFTLMCESTPISTGWLGMINAADFDHDGVPEIFVGRQVYSFDFSNPAAPTLTRKLVGTGNSGGPPGAGSGLWDVSAAADILSRTDCNGDPDCDGLELAAGTHIYSIDLDPTDGDGLQIKIQRNLNLLSPGNNLSDGYTQIADINLDGTPDIVVNGVKNVFTNVQNGFYAWDKNGLISFFPAPAFSNFASWGKLTIANVYDDRKAGFARDYPEIIRKMGDTLRMAAYNLQAQSLNAAKPFWWEAPSDDRSAGNFVAAFDFNRDGFDELVAKGDTFLRVYYGGAAPFPPGVNPINRIWFQIGHLAGTVSDGAVVADIDADQEAEILYSFRTAGNNGKLRVLKSSQPTPWPPARKLWNNYNYFTAAINDDLSVPKTQQKHWLEMGGIGSGKRPFNTHLAQVGSLNPLYTNKLKVPDANLAIDSIHCQQDSFELFITICNQGSAVLPDQTPIAFYLGDPTTAAAPLLFPVLKTTETMAVGACKKTVLKIPATYNTSIFAVVNDDGSLPRPFSLSSSFPSTGQAECQYENNMASFALQNQTPTLDLGADTKICKNSVQELVASPGFQTYRWQDGSLGSRYTAFGAGKYWVDAFDACGFKQTDTLYISLDTLNALQLPDELSFCPGASINLTVSGFTKYNWSPADSLDCADCPSVNVLGHHPLTLYLTASNGNCFVSDSVQVRINPNPALSLTVQPGDCDTPSAVAAHATGNAPFMYAWSNLSSDSTINNIISGTYTVEITDSYGCKATDSVTVAFVNSLAVSALPSAPGCANAASGSIDLSVLNGVAPFEFIWSNSALTEDLSAVPAGTYTVTVTDANDCSATYSATLAAPPALQLGLHKSDPACAGEASGQLDLSASGGTGAFQYSWSNSSMSADLVNLSAGTYTATVVDANGCTASVTQTLVDPPAIVLDLQMNNPSCAATANGALDLTATGGTGGLQFSWSNSASTADQTLLPAGTYTVTTTDANGCTASLSETLADPPAILLSLQKSDPRCAGEANGQLDLTASGGTGSLQFAWSNSATMADLMDIPAGVYSLIVGDANGCSASITETLTDPPALVLALIKTDLNCPGDTVLIDLSASGGTGLLNFLWTGGASTEDISISQSGTYTVSVVDANGCSQVDSVSVATLGSAPQLQLTTDTLTCAHPTAIISVSADVPNTQFLWSGAGSFSSSDPSPVISAAGSYTVTATTLAGACTASGTVLVAIDTIRPQVVVPADFLEIPCDESTIQLSAAGSSTGPNLAINWTASAGGSIVSGQNSLLPLVEGAGVYEIQLTDVSNGCSASQQVEVVQLDRPVGSVQADDVRCYGEVNGSILVLVGAGGTAPFEYSIDNQTFTPDSIFENLPAGQYEVYVRDANECGFSTVVTIAEPTPFSVELTGDVLAIPGVPANLQVLLSPPGFVPAEIEWEANNVVLNEQHQLELSLELLQTTLFQVKISDGNGCSASDTWLVEFDDAHDIYIPNIMQLGNAGGTGQIFQVFSDAGVQEVDYLQVFDRWGNQVFLNRHFQPNDETAGWDGRFRGKAVNPGVLTWVVKVIFKDGSSKILKGDLTVIR